MNDERGVRLSDLGIAAPVPDPPRRGRPVLVPLVVVLALGVAVTAWAVAGPLDERTPSSDPLPADETGAGTGHTATTEPAQTTTTAPPFDGWVDPASAGTMWSDTVPGILTFRGNPTRSWYGRGPMPSAPRVLWTYPAEGSMCGPSSVGGQTTIWCGTGWTGQPAVWEGRDGRTWVAFGAYDHRVHWLDWQSGDRLLPPFTTGDIIKGSVTIDPDGFPLLYTGSRDDYFRVIAMDGSAPRELWRLYAEAVSPTLWNDDWDGSALVIDDFLFVGGENSRLHIVRLNRGYAPDGSVTVDPELVFDAPGWDAELLGDVGDEQVSIEASVTIVGDVVYFANSGGLVQGWDISGLEEGVEPTRVFRFWTGDDTDATITADSDGMLYVASQYERGLPRAREVGQIMKLDPRATGSPVLWSVKDLPGGRSGVWATPALWRDVVYAATNSGRILGIDRTSGQVLWEKNLRSQTWQSPVVVDDVLVVGDCEGNLNAYDVRDTRIDPPLLWTVKLEGCIESTPAVWNGRIFVGTRAGRMYAIGDG